MARGHPCRDLTVGLREDCSLSDRIPETFFLPVAGSLALGTGPSLRTVIVLGAAIASIAPAGRPVARAQQMVWLNINVETRAGAEGQRSWAVASTSSDKEATTKTRVRKLYLVLDGHTRQEQECEDCDSLQVEEYHEGEQFAQVRARAWAEGPTIGVVEASADSPR